MLVIDEGKTVVELLPDGKLGEKHTLQLPPGGLAGFLRTTTDKDGKRWFLCGANGLQQIHLFDEKFEHKVDYPADATSNPHAGIADAQIGDLDGDGTPELCVGYWGVVGVQGVSLEGKRIWANKSLATVLRVAILDPDDKGQRNVLCTNQRGTLVLLNPREEAKGKSPFRFPAPLDRSRRSDRRPEIRFLRLGPTPEGDLTGLGSVRRAKCSGLPAFAACTSVRSSRSALATFSPARLGSGSWWRPMVRSTSCRRRQADRPVQLWQHGDRSGRAQMGRASRAPGRPRLRGLTPGKSRP